MDLFAKDPLQIGYKMIATPERMIDEATFQSLSENQKGILVRTEWIRGAISLMRYFGNGSNNMPNIESFLNGNKEFMKWANADLDRLYDSYKKDEPHFSTNTEQLIASNYVREVEQKDFDNLFRYKLSEGKRIFNFKTENIFAEQELEKFERDYNDYSHLPIYKQWVNYLKKDRSTINIMPVTKSESPGSQKAYKWLGIDTELSDLYQKMKGILIANETEIRDFILIFSGVEISKNHSYKMARWECV